MRRELEGTTVALKYKYQYIYKYELTMVLPCTAYTFI
jgi:hypothetical protein